MYKEILRKEIEDKHIKVIYFAGGCFWGVEKLFKGIKGVVDTTVGYANGITSDPTYKDVCTGNTGHRETVEIVYDTDVVSLDTLLTAYFMVIDPALKDRQGHDIGTQYQTGVYYKDPEDLNTIENRFNKERQNYPHFYAELNPLHAFYPAEAMHQDYLDIDPQGYCHISYSDMEKVYQHINEDSGDE